jgi:hypothetical protein
MLIPSTSKLFEKYNEGIRTEEKIPWIIPSRCTYDG